MKNIVAILLFIFITTFGISQNTNLLTEKTIPNFTGTDEQGNLWDLSKNTSKYLVVYFYPAAMTSGCTSQACAYRDDASQFKKMNTTVIGISGDEVKNLKQFKDSYHLNFTLLSDPQGKIANLFGVPTSRGGLIHKNFNGKELQFNRGVTAARWTYILDEDRTVIYKNSNVNAANDSKEIQKILKQFQLDDDEDANY